MHLRLLRAHVFVHTQTPTYNQQYIKYTYTFTYMHIHMYLHIHRHGNRHRHRHNTCRHTPAHSCIYVLVHMHDAYVYACTHVCINGQKNIPEIHASAFAARACVCAYTYTHIQSTAFRTQAFQHTDTHTDTHTCKHRHACMHACAHVDTRFADHMEQLVQHVRCID